MFNKIHFFEEPFAVPFSIPSELEKKDYLKGRLVIISNKNQANEFNKAICSKSYLPEQVGIYVKEEGHWRDVSEFFGIIAHLVNKFTYEVSKED